MSIETTVITTLRCDTPVSVLEDEHGEARTIAFSLDGRHYEREACAGCELDFALEIDEFLKAARPAGAKRARPHVRTAARRRHTAAVRQWAREQGIPVSDIGRIPASVFARYDAEHGDGR